MKKKRSFKFIWLVLMAFILFFAFVFTSCHVINRRIEDSVQKPIISYGEFPFKLIYRLEDEIITVEDTYVCKFMGADWGFDVGPVRTWKGYIKGTERKNILVAKDGEYEIVVNVGGYSYYMGLYDASKEPYKPTIRKNGPQGSSFLLDSEEALDLYGLEIVSFEHVEPVQALAEPDDLMELEYEKGGIW